MKSGHGGRRAGAGRKPVLGLVDRISVGAEFERRWLEVQEAEAEAKYDMVARNADAQHEIEKHQERLRDARVHLTQPQQKNIAKKRWKEVDASLDKIGRSRSMPLKRPKGQRAAVINNVVDWWNERFPGSEITPRYVAECIVEYREFLRDSKSPT
jgi:hypothetical protein